MKWRTCWVDFCCCRQDCYCLVHGVARPIREGIRPEFSAEMRVNITFRDDEQVLLVRYWRHPGTVCAVMSCAYGRKCTNSFRSRDRIFRSVDGLIRWQRINSAVRSYFSGSVPISITLLTYSGVIGCVRGKTGQTHFLMNTEMSITPVTRGSVRSSPMLSCTRRVCWKLKWHKYTCLIQWLELGFSVGSRNEHPVYGGSVPSERRSLR